MISPAHPTNTLALLAVCAAAGIAQAAEPAYPTRPVRLVVGFAPGGGGDTMARIIAPKLSDSMGQTWVVDNRSGATGNLATEIVARANADGYTMLLGVETSITANPSLYKLPFNVQKDLQPITLLAMVDQILVVHPSVQAKTVPELVALAKQKPGALNYGSAGTGSANHLGMLMLEKRAGISMVHVPYKGGGPRSIALLAGEIQASMGSVASMITFVQAGRLRGLAIASGKRSRLVPDLPTVAESGYPGYDASSWYALLAPGGTPKSITERIRNDTLKALQSAETQANMERLGLEPASSTQAELAARIKTESATWAGVIKEAGIRAE